MDYFLSMSEGDFKLGISFGSINTGLPKDIVQQLVNAERIPITKMEDQKSKMQDKQKLVEQLSGILGQVRTEVTKNMNSRSFRELQFDTNKGVVDVKLDKNLAKPGNYQLEVTQLAQKSSAMSSAFADRKDSYIGVGFIQFELPNGEEKEIYIDADNSSLDGIAKLINSDPENGITANVINDGTGSDKPWRLIFNVAGTGEGNKAEFPHFYFVDGDEDFYLEKERPAQNAKVKLDGFEIETPENMVTDLIPGVTLQLLQAKPGEEFSLKITEDIVAITEKISAMVEKINDVIKFIKEQNTLDQHTDTSRTLGGDIMLQSLEGRLRGVIFRDIPTNYGNKRFGDLGVEFIKDGTLKLDKAKFESMLSNNYQMVSEVLTGYYTSDKQYSPGFIKHLDDVVNNSLRTPDGLLTSRTRSLKSSIEQVDRRIANKERMIKQKEQNLKRKFAQLETTISNIKNSGAGLAALNGAASAAANPVAQLG